MCIKRVNTINSSFPRTNLIDKPAPTKISKYISHEIHEDIEKLKERAIKAIKFKKSQSKFHYYNEIKPFVTKTAVREYDYANVVESIKKVKKNLEELGIDVELITILKWTKEYYDAIKPFVIKVLAEVVKKNKNKGKKETIESIQKILVTKGIEISSGKIIFFAKQFFKDDFNEIWKYDPSVLKKKCFTKGNLEFHKYLEDARLDHYHGKKIDHRDACESLMWKPIRDLIFQFCKEFNLHQNVYELALDYLNKYLKRAGCGVSTRKKGIAAALLTISINKLNIYIPKEKLLEALKINKGAFQYSLIEIKNTLEGLWEYKGISNLTINKDAT